MSFVIQSNMAIMLKKAANSDISILLELEKSVAGSILYSPMLTEDEWLVALDIGVIYLIEKDNTVVGNISYEKKKNGNVHISGLVVKPEFQGQGLGRAALIKVLQELKNIKRIDLVTHPKNTKALALYQSLGFVVELQKENYYGDGQPRLIMVLVEK